jgi:hypothetical protein
MGIENHGIDLDASVQKTGTSCWTISAGSWEYRSVERSRSPNGELNGSNRVPSKRNNPLGLPSHRNPSLVWAKHVTSAGAPCRKVQES